MKEKYLPLCGRYKHCQSYPLDAIIEMSKAVGREIRLENLLKGIIEKTAELMDCDRCTVFVYDETTNELWSYVAIGIDSNEIRFPLGAGIAGDSALTRKKVNIPDAYSDSRFNREFDEKNGYRTRSILCCPMINVEGRLIGVLEAINKNTGGAFGEEDEVMIECLSGCSAIGIERTFLTDKYIEYKKNQEIMSFAREIQMNMLPADFSTIACGSNAEVYAFISPATDVGGDFYDYFFVGDNRLCFAIGDVSGKGVPAALFMAVAKTLFSTIARGGATPGQILHRMNQELSRSNEMMMFVTMFAGILDTATGLLTYSNGGHNSPYIVFGDGKIEKLEAAAGTAVGLMDKTVYEEAAVTLNGSSAIFLYTDGVDEAKDESGRMFTVARLEAVLRGIAFNSLRGMADKVLSEVAGFTAGAPQSDDITILTVKLNGRAIPSEGGLYDRSFDCKIDNIPIILDFIGEAAGSLGFGGSFAFDVKVAVDEACTNIIDYNCAVGCKIDISVETNGQDFIVAIKNCGEPFNPTTVKPPDISLPLEERQIGGLGIFFMKQLMDKIDYESKDGLNTLTMVKRRPINTQSEVNLQ
ncbi:MAG: SpoIIE family protein phosphatase [Nitrospirae bacterium]|nr:SpoIIE family protein phosphatase [Nitrospirota bacterium]